MPGLTVPKTILKRDGRTVPFDPQRITIALGQCFGAIGTGPTTGLTHLTDQIVNAVAYRAKAGQPVTVELVQDLATTVLGSNGETQAADAYRNYRMEHERLRWERPIPPEVAAAFAHGDSFFPTPLQQFQYYDKYARYNPTLGRRETWPETVKRTMDALYGLAGPRITPEEYNELEGAILGMGVMPSMRLLAMAGPAFTRSHLTGFNCSYLAVDSLDAFVEALIISMSGCGVGYSVEKRYVEQLPRVQRQKVYVHNPASIVLDHYTVADSSEGWADALRYGLEHWFSGTDCTFDFTHIRPYGTPLLTKGGRASGPEPLRQLLAFARNRILARQGSFLTTLDAHDLMCWVGNAAVSGGVRRTALISLFDWDDDDMRGCKDGDFSQANPQRWNANNSVVWPERKLTQIEIGEQMIRMARGGNGEPGIFSRLAANTLKPERRKKAEYGTNPCCEILLKNCQTCNLSMAIARHDDTAQTLLAKVRLASMVGTIQSMATNFPGLRPEWKRNCEEERLLGVDINGQMDSPVAQDPGLQPYLKQQAIQVNHEFALRLGINPSASVTCVKPSGNSSQLLNCSSGLHARWSPYYIRNVRVGTDSPLFKVLRDAGVPMDPENGQTPLTATTWVIHFPVASPQGAGVQTQRTALEQLNYWKQVKLGYTEHNPSATISYQPDELLDVIKWVYEHQAVIGGLSFLPASDTTYKQMPYEQITEERYHELQAAWPKGLEFAKLVRYESEDNEQSSASTTAACEGPSCVVEFVPQT